MNLSGGIFKISIFLLLSIIFDLIILFNIEADNLESHMRPPLSVIVEADNLESHM